MIRLNTAVNTSLGKAWMLRAVGSSYEAIPIGFHVFGERGSGSNPYNAAAAYWLLTNAPSSLDARLKDFLTTFMCGYLYYRLEWDDEEQEEDFDFNEEAKRVLDQWADAYIDDFGLRDNQDQIVSNLFDLIEGMSLDEIKERGSTITPDAGEFIAEYLDENFIRVRMNDAYKTTGGTEGVCYFRLYSHSRNWVNQIWSFVRDHKEIQVVVVERDELDDDGVSAYVKSSKLYIDNMRREEFLSKDHLPFLGSRTI